jgi:hypothetical protein
MTERNSLNTIFFSKLKSTEAKKKKTASAPRGGQAPEELHSSHDLLMISGSAGLHQTSRLYLFEDVSLLHSNSVYTSLQRSSTTQLNNKHPAVLCTDTFLFRSDLRFPRS